MKDERRRFLLMKTPLRSSFLIHRSLLDGRTMRTYYLPTPVFFGVNVSVANPSINRLPLIVAALKVVDTRHHARVTFNSDLHVRRNGGVKDVFPVFDVGDIFGRGVKFSGQAANTEIIISEDRKSVV